jgi:hypothetical protein
LIASTGELSQLPRRLAARDQVRSEATVQADVRQLFTGGLVSTTTTWTSSLRPRPEIAGTFLFHAVRRYLDAAAEAGIASS